MFQQDSESDVKMGHVALPVSHEYCSIAVGPLGGRSSIHPSFTSTYGTSMAEKLVYVPSGKQT
jgi:hypothetical protein